MQEGKEKEQPVEYDAIVIGTGISGGWAAKELCEKGLKTLVLERGRMVRHVVDYPTMHMEAWDFEHRGETTAEDRKRQEKQARTGYTTDEQWRHWFVDDIDHPYTETKRFDWMRGYHVGEGPSRGAGIPTVWDLRILRPTRKTVTVLIGPFAIRIWHPGTTRWKITLASAAKILVATRSPTGSSLSRCRSIAWRKTLPAGFTRTWRAELLPTPE